MADTHSLASKLTYRPARKLEVFYTGGAARLTRDGKLLACACGDEIKVRQRRADIYRCDDGDGADLGRGTPGPFMGLVHGTALALDAARLPVCLPTCFVTLWMYGGVVLVPAAWWY